MNTERNEIVFAALEEAAHKAAPLFRFFGWAWHNNRNIGVLDIQRNIEDNLRSIVKHDCASCGSGRIVVRREKPESGDGWDYRIYLDLADMHNITDECLLEAIGSKD